MRAVNSLSLQCFDDRDGVAHGEKRSRARPVLETAWVEACTEDSCRARCLSLLGTWYVLLLDVSDISTHDLLLGSSFECDHPQIISNLRGAKEGKA